MSRCRGEEEEEKKENQEEKGVAVFRNSFAHDRDFSGQKAEVQSGQDLQAREATGQRGGFAVLRLL